MADQGVWVTLGTLAAGGVLGFATSVGKDVINRRWARQDEAARVKREHEAYWREKRIQAIVDTSKTMRRCLWLCVINARMKEDWPKLAETKLETAECFIRMQDELIPYLVLVTEPEVYQRAERAKGEVRNVLAKSQKKGKSEAEVREVMQAARRTEDLIVLFEREARRSLGLNVSVEHPGGIDELLETGRIPDDEVREP